MPRGVFYVFLLLLCVLPVRGSLQIAEIMTENDGGLRDEDGDAPDWIEIHNAGVALLSLEGFHLTDDASFPTRWKFPAVNIPSGGCIVVFASGKNKTTTPLHTNFRLEKENGFVALV